MIKKLAKAALPALVAAGAIAAAAVPAQADRAGIAAPGCIVRVTLVTNFDLQEPPKDEIYLKVGGGPYTKNVTFEEFEDHPGTEFGSSADVSEFASVGGSVVIQVWESDWGRDEHLGNVTVDCDGTAFSDADTVNGFNSLYEVAFAVTATA